jgi:hypothetical protein
LTEEDTVAIELLDTLYSTKQLQYIVTGAKAFPIFGPLKRASLKLAQGVGRAVGFPPLNLAYVP